jgi:hypothetical protein
MIDGAMFGAISSGFRRATLSLMTPCDRSKNDDRRHACHIKTEGFVRIAAPAAR